MTADLEPIEASYLQHKSFVGQRVVVPAVGASPAIYGVLSDVAQYRRGIATRTVACPNGPGHDERFRVSRPCFELFLGGRCIVLAPGDLVLVEPMPAAPTHS